MMTLLYLLLLPMLSGIGMLGLGPALMAGRAGAAHVVLLLSGLLLPLRGLMYLLLARRRGNRPGRMSVVLAAVELLLGAGLLLLPQLSVRLFAVVVAVYLTLLVTVEAVNAILYGRMRRWGAFFPAMAAAAGGTGLFVLIVFVPALRDAALRYTAALLLTVFGTGLVCDVLALTIRSRRVRRVLGSIRVALPDVMLPDIDGFEVCRRIRASNTRIGIIMLTARSQEMDKVTGLMTGADDYVTKPFSPAELTARIDALFRRTGGEQDAEDTGEIRQGPFRLNTRNRTLEKNGERVRLTQIEFSIIKYFMDNPGKALSREDILNEVWGRDYFGELKIVDVNIRRLRIKIEDDPTMPAYITTVWGYGYKWGL